MPKFDKSAEGLSLNQRPVEISPNYSRISPFYSTVLFYEYERL